jgi:hypothetical protein
MDKNSNEYMIQKYKVLKAKEKAKNKLWQEQASHKEDAKKYYELNKKRLNLRSAELLRQKNNVKKALKLQQKLEERASEGEAVSVL